MVNPHLTARIRAYTIRARRIAVSLPVAHITTPPSEKAQGRFRKALAA